jgi:hypothetical protein
MGFIPRISFILPFTCDVGFVLSVYVLFLCFRSSFVLRLRCCAALIIGNFAANLHVKKYPLNRTELLFFSPFSLYDILMLASVQDEVMVIYW